MTAVVVMGVSGGGKTTVGTLVAAAGGWPFFDADDFHPPANRAKMAAKVPLTDDDRQPWLVALAALIGRHRDSGQSMVLACSALKRSYRDLLRAGHQDVVFAHLSGDRETLLGRLQQRRGHYMPPDLLDSQLATLEPPAADEGALTLDVRFPPEALAEAVATWLTDRGRA